MFRLLVILFVTKTSHCKNSLMLGPKGPEQDIFGSYFYSKNNRKLRFHVFFLFHVRKHIRSSFYLKWTEFTRNYQLCSIYGSPGTRTKLEQILNFLWIRSTSGKTIISYIPSIKMEEYMELEEYFLSKNGRQKYSAWVPGGPFLCIWYFQYSVHMYSRLPQAQRLHNLFWIFFSISRRQKLRSCSVDLVVSRIFKEMFACNIYLK